MAGLVVTAQMLDSILSGATVLLLAFIGRGMLGMRRDFRRFMAEHAWLLATTLWNRDKVLKIMARLEMPIENSPPDDLPVRR